MGHATAWYRDTDWKERWTSWLELAALIIGGILSIPIWALMIFGWACALGAPLYAIWLLLNYLF